MLTTLTLINSCTYDLAELDFSHGSSMQLVGGNNVGKSSLIYALNFLFVIDRRRMSFMGRKPADKTTMEYYFPTAEESFIVFEISKRGRRYCVLVWRDGGGHPCYGRVMHAYDRGIFFAESEGGLLSQSLQSLRKKWVKAGVEFKEMKTVPSEVFHTVYHTGQQNDAAVWLRNSAVGKGAEGFSKLYRYLIDTRLIDDSALREILMLADNRSATKLSYGRDSMQDLERLRVMQSRTELLRRHQVAFTSFREGTRTLSSEQTGLGGDIAHFHFHCTRGRARLEEERQRHGTQIEENRRELDALRSQIEKINQQIGGLRIDLKNKENDGRKIAAQLAEIRTLPTGAFLRQTLENHGERLNTINFELAELRQSRFSTAELERQIKLKNTRIAELNRQREAFADWLIFHLADTDQDRRKLNALLSNAVARSSKEGLRKQVQRTGAIVRLFDGEFDWPANLPLPDLPSPEAIAEEIAAATEDQDRLKRQLKAAENREGLEKEIRELEQKQLAVRAQLTQLGQLPELESQLQTAEAAAKQVGQEMESLETTLGQHRGESRRRQEAFELLKDKQRADEERAAQIRRWASHVEEMQERIPAAELEFTGALDVDLGRLFQELAARYKAFRELSLQNTNNFQLLRRDFLSETADPETFIEEIQQDYLGLDDQEANIATLVENISNRFSNPAANFLHQFQLFSEYISKKFNRRLAKVSISNIESLRIELIPNASLQRDLRKIGELDLHSEGLFKGKQGGLSVLKTYIENGKEINFAELFSLKLKLTIGGKEKTVDLSKQVESDGTDRMLRLVIVMQVISQLVLLGPENRIVVFIDEIATIDGKNRPQLVDFCREHHFYPIFAAPESVEGFDRYVFINRDAGGRLVVQRNKNYVDVERD